MNDIDDRLHRAVRDLQTADATRPTYGVFDDADDGRLIEGGFPSADAAEGIAEYYRAEGEQVRVEPQCHQHPGYPEGEQCEDCAEPNEKETSR
ncbi:hypothetical protein [Kitasatospora viridis]|uniref:Uncharacterized protein n=1 Tax=Kitasatospora viridis TaxID=281105 RepID=A0A561SA32_9ACTN|nr:hypothetical protein [Kitasatospora viridis]TWF71731.1 hypothetical protein FHX73_18102 [Kitasatospora viridis]